MKAIIPAFISGVFLWLVSCHPVPSGHLDGQAQRIEFGNGGGFSGQTTQYTLTPDGKLLMKEGIAGASQSLKQLKQQETRRLFDEVSALHLDTLRFNHPGNRYYFIRWQSGNNPYEVKWGDERMPVPQSVQAVYQKLLASTEN